MDILHALSLIPGIIYVGLVFISYLIVIGNISLFFNSFAYIILQLGPILLILWVLTGKENIFKEKTFKKIIKYLSYLYIILIILAIFPYVIYLSYLSEILVLLTSCILGYISAILDAMILYYLYKKIKQFYAVLSFKLKNF